MDVITLTTSQSFLTGSSLVNTIDGGDDTGLILGTDDEVEDARVRELFFDDFSFEE